MFEGRRKWIAGAVAGLTGLIGIEIGRHGGKEAQQKVTDKSGEVVRKPRDMGRPDALVATRRLQDEEVSREIDQEQIAQVKAGIDALFAQSPHGFLELSAGELKTEGLEEFAKIMNEIPHLKIVNDSMDGPAVVYREDEDENGDSEEFRLANIIVEDDGSYTLDGSKFNRGVDQFNIHGISGLKNVLEEIKRNFVVT